ncbi:MAG: FliM/FliN family flagellar motor switch protein [Deltaproteobacteria bacterium]|nr:FliM/FliN family flagellar motor switch protein [Deltaproteobacteria bacterium]
MAPDDSFLDGEEFAAIREALSSSQAKRRSGAQERVQLDASPVALIAEDRAAERALPDGQKIVDRWISEVKIVLGRMFGKDLECVHGMAETVDSNGVKRALEKAWIVRVEIAGRRGVCLLAVSGPLLEATAVQRFGGEVIPTGTGRNPSGTVLSLFAPLGHALARTLGEAWKELQGATVEFGDDDMALERGRRALELAKLSVVIEIHVHGNVEGSLRIVASPEMLAAPPRALDAVPAEPGAIALALGGVKSLLRVELGRFRISLKKLRKLKPGTVLTLDRFVGDRLPVRCAGVLVGQGKAVLSRGAVSVEMAGK